MDLNSGYRRYRQQDTPSLPCFLKIYPGAIELLGGKTVKCQIYFEAHHSCKDLQLCCDQSVAERAGVHSETCGTLNLIRQCYYSDYSIHIFQRPGHAISRSLEVTCVSRDGQRTWDDMGQFVVCSLPS